MPPVKTVQPPLGTPVHVAGFAGEASLAGCLPTVPGSGCYRLVITTVVTSCRFEYSVRPKLAFFKQGKFTIKPCKILNLKHQYEHACGVFFFFIFKKFVFLTLHMSKKQTVKTNQDVGETKVKYTQWQMNRVLAQVCEPVQKSCPGSPWGLGTVS